FRCRDCRLSSRVRYACTCAPRTLITARTEGARAERQPARARPRCPSGRVTDILNERRSISADTAFRLGRYFGNRPQFWLDLQSQYDLAVVERKGAPRSRSACAPPTRHSLDRPLHFKPLRLNTAIMSAICAF